MSRKKYLIINVILLLIVLVGGTYAFYEWQSNTNTDITLSVEGLKVLYKGGTNISGTTIIPTSTKNQGISKTIEVKLDSSNIITPTPTMNLYLELTKFPSQLKDPSFKWELYKGNDLISNDTLNNNEGDIIALTNNQNITNTKDTYNLYLWIDSNMDNNPAMQDQPFNFEVRATGTNSLVTELVEINGVLILSDGTPCSECNLTFQTDPITTTTDLSGNYHITNLSTGTHNVIATKNSIEVLNDNIEIKLGNDITVNNKVITTNTNKFYMNLKVNADKSIDIVKASTTE